jgi:hypothetical protein
MEKYSTPVAAEENPTPKSSGKCDACGCVFPQKGETPPVDRYGRKETRDQINIPIYRAGVLRKIVTHCGPCYDRELYQRGRGQLSDVMGRVPYATGDAIKRAVALEADAAKIRKHGP